MFKKIASSIIITMSLQASSIINIVPASFKNLTSIVKNDIIGPMDIKQQADAFVQGAVMGALSFGEFELYRKYLPIDQKKKTIIVPNFLFFNTLNILDIMNKKSQKQSPCLGARAIGSFLVRFAITRMLDA